MKVWAFDIETVINCFTVTFIDVDNQHDIRQFVICELDDFETKSFNKGEDLRSFMETITKEDLLVGYNSLNFDLPILSKVFTLCGGFEAHIPWMVYKDAQSIIVDNAKIDVFAEWNLRLIPHLDLFKLHHFDNEAKRTSLKWIQCHLNMDNIEEMPHPHDKPVKKLSDIESILSYNANDVKATAQLYLHKKTQDLIELRRWAINKYSLTTGYNTSNAHMGESVFLKQLGSIPPADKSTRTIFIKDIIIPDIKFKSRPFNDLLNSYKQTTTYTKGSTPGSPISGMVIFDNMRYKFGFGGIHAAREQTIHEDIDSVDVKSFYPNLAIQFGFKPKHVGDKFTKIYQNLYEERMAATNPVHNSGLKESLNSVFGKSNSEFSPLYDPGFTYSITINGQLLIAMLCEEITLSKAGRIIIANTDGIEVSVTNRALFEEIVQQWSDRFKMPLSFSRYEKLVIRDVNNYIGIINHSEFKYKLKGAYEVEKDFHKDPSAQICAIAVRNYYLMDIPIEDTINNVDSIDKFFLYRRAKTGKFKGIPKDGSAFFDLPKTLRYLVTDEGFVFYHITDDSEIKVHADAYITVYNNKDVIERVNIDRAWYIKEAKKLLIPKTLSLF